MGSDFKKRLINLETKVAKVNMRLNTVEKHMNAMLDKDKLNTALYIAWGLVALSAAALAVIGITIL